METIKGRQKSTIIPRRAPGGGQQNSSRPILSKIGTRNYPIQCRSPHRCQVGRLRGFAVNYKLPEVKQKRKLRPTIVLQEYIRSCGQKDPFDGNFVPLASGKEPFHFREERQKSGDILSKVPLTLTLVDVAWRASSVERLIPRQRQHSTLILERIPRRRGAEMDTPPTQVPGDRLVTSDTKNNVIEAGIARSCAPAWTALHNAPHPTPAGHAPRNFPTASSKNPHIRLSRSPMPRAALTWWSAQLMASQHTITLVLKRHAYLWAAVTMPMRIMASANPNPGGSWATASSSRRTGTYLGRGSTPLKWR